MNKYDMFAFFCITNGNICFSSGKELGIALGIAFLALSFIGFYFGYKAND